MAGKKTAMTDMGTDMTGKKTVMTLGNFNVEWIIVMRK
jgi:hypothetical protein